MSTAVRSLRNFLQMLYNSNPIQPGASASQSHMLSLLSSTLVAGHRGMKCQFPQNHRDTKHTNKNNCPLCRINVLNPCRTLGTCLIVHKHAHKMIDLIRKTFVFAIRKPERAPILECSIARCIKNGFSEFTKG